MRNITLSSSDLRLASGCSSEKPLALSVMYVYSDMHVEYILNYCPWWSPGTLLMDNINE